MLFISHTESSNGGGVEDHHCAMIDLSGKLTIPQEPLSNHMLLLIACHGGIQGCPIDKLAGVPNFGIEALHLHLENFTTACVWTFSSFKIMHFINTIPAITLFIFSNIVLRARN